MPVIFNTPFQTAAGGGDFAAWTATGAVNISVDSDTQFTVTNNGNGVYSSVFTETFKSSGKYYLEFTGQSANLNPIVGIATANTDSMHSNLYTTGDYMMYYGTAGNQGIYSNGGLVTGAVPTFEGVGGAADVIAIAVDFDLNTIEFFKNNSSVYSTSKSFAAAAGPMGSGDGSGGGNVTIINWGSGGFTYTPPGGFTNWPSS